MFYSSFPMLSALHSKHELTLSDDQFLEYRYAVDYHLDLAEAAQRASSESLWRSEWHYSGTSNGVYLRTETLAQLIRNGDIAIRETVSALDTALVLINKILALGVPQSKVRWGAKKQDEPMRVAMRKHPTRDYSQLVKILDSVYSSKGMESLRGYRDWVTHRGAPRLIVPEGLSNLIAIPPEVLNDPPLPEQMPDIGPWLKHRIESYLLQLISDEVQVVCWPFVPPVQSVFSGTFDTVDEDIVPTPGVFIEKGARNITIKNARTVHGSLMQPIGDFDSNNQHQLAIQLSEIAGEGLAAYSAPDYMHGISSTVRFMDEALSGELDAQLVHLLQV